MKQLIMTGPRKSKVVEVPIPEIGDNELLVKVKYSGMCHSEWYPWSTASPGDILGHESMGVVAKTGKNVKGFHIGDRVTGLGGGAFKEYILMEPGKTVHIPDNVADEDAVAEPLACLLSAAMKLPPEMLGDPVAVVGCGYMGLGTISLFKAMGYGDIVAIDPRPEALENARKFGATETYTPDTIPPYYLLNWETMGKPDLTRDGTNADLFNVGFRRVMEFSGTESGLRLAGDLVCAHGTLGIGGYHNDSFRSIDYKLWNFKAITTINCHERRIEYEAGLCERCMMLLSKGIWKFTGLADERHIYSLEEFDRGNEEMADHTDGFIKGLVRT